MQRGAENADPTPPTPGNHADGKLRSLGRWLGRGVLAALAIAVYWLVVRPWFLGWGATEEERKRRLPGHELVPEPAVNNTQATTIDAPPQSVWPWLVQIGQGRAGFYSYDWLERVIGTDPRNTDRIVPEYQTLNEGDEIAFAPREYWAGSSDAWPVVDEIVENDRLVLRTPTDPPSYVWTFQLTPLGDDRTRLVTRVRSRQKTTPLGRLRVGLTGESIHFLIQRKMLLGVKERAEQRPAEATL